MGVKLSGGELIEVLNNNFLGKFIGFDINDVFWTGVLDIREKTDFGTVYDSKGVSFYILEDKDYYYSFSGLNLTIKEVK